ncbi:MAG: hypothetical protein M1839_005463 [Geoglossum umbratile]|nr:MAG: hypothetical protein M1839_005463 [Geoglossum umbratile]
MATLAVAQSPNGPNPFSIPGSGLAFVAGTPSTISWTPTTSGTITILLRKGPSGQLDAGTAIAKNIPNSGSISWTPPSDLVKGSDYAFEIIDDTNSGNSNFTPQFSIDSTNTVSKSATSAVSTSTSVATTSATTTSSAATTSATSGTSSATSSSYTSTLATKTTTSTSSSTPSSTPQAGAAAPVMKVSGGLVLLALGMLAL